MLMALVSYLAVSGIVAENLTDSAQKSLVAADIRIMETFSEMDILLNNTAFTIQDMIEQGRTQEELLTYLTRITGWLRSRSAEGARFTGIYGYLRGEFMDSIGFNPTKEYIPQERPWYQLGIRSNGKTVYTAPFIDERTDRLIISAVREVYDKTGASLGMISL
jgi:hypothetical protein